MPRSAPAWPATARRHVVVDDILTSSDAFRRGLRYGDEVLSFAGRPTSTVNGFKNVLGIYPKGWRVPLVYRRDDQIVDILVRLAGVHAEAELAQLLDAQVQPDKMPGGPHGKRARATTPRPEQRKSRGPDGHPARSTSCPMDQPPDDEAPEDEGPRDPEQPQAGHGRARLPLPEIVQEALHRPARLRELLLQPVEHDRVWRALASRGDLSALAGNWTIRGTLASGGDFEIELSDKQVAAADSRRRGQGQAQRPPGRIARLRPAAAACWSRWRCGGGCWPAGRSSSAICTTWGPRRCPTGPAWPTCWSARIGGVETPVSWSIRATARCVQLEMLPDDDADPCEVYFARLS